MNPAAVRAMGVTDCHRNFASGHPFQLTKNSS